MLACTPDDFALDVLPAAPTRDQLEAFGEMLETIERNSGQGPLDISTQHHHADKLYGRSIVLRAGTFLAGLPHKAGHMNVCIGDITVWSEGGRHRYTGITFLVSKPGAQRVGFAHADTTWLTVSANLTGSTDPEVIEAALVEHPERLMSRRAGATLLGAD